jgi:hypothetical protein
MAADARQHADFLIIARTGASGSARGVLFSTSDWDKRTTFPGVFCDVANFAWGA